MGYQNGFRDFESNLQMNLQTGEDPWGYQNDTGFFLNAQTSIGQFVDEEMSISRYINEAPRRERNEKIRQAYADGMIPEEIWQAGTRQHRRGTKVDWDFLANHLKEAGLEVVSDEELDQRIRGTLQERRSYAQDVFNSQNGMGAVGQVAGTFVGAGADPINIFGGMIVGTEAAAARAFILTNVGKQFARSAAMGVATESLIQSKTVEWKQYLGVDYTAKDALLNIAMAGLATGALDGVAQVGRNLLSRAGARIPTSKVTGLQVFASDDWKYYRAHLDNFGPEGDIAADALPIDYYMKEIAQHPNKKITVQQFQEDMIKWNQRVSHPDEPGIKIDPIRELDDAQLQEHFDTLIANKPDAILADVQLVDGQAVPVARRAADVVQDLKVRHEILKKVEGCILGG